MATWGLSATILAPAPDILRFVAHHLDHGAQCVYIYLDDDNQAALDALQAHPKVRAQICDAAYWERVSGRRPAKHQARQTMNATHAYGHKPEVDWLVHMDVDEFLIPDTSVADALDRVPPETTSARVRPMELLGGSETAFKAFLPAGRKRQRTTEAIYPTFGKFLKGGFLSHVAGKLFVRTGLPDVEVRIHNAFQSGQMLPDAMELHDMALAHCHAKSWEAWRAAYAYRLKKGSYRAELKPAIKPEHGGLTLHELFRWLEMDQGEAGLRTFYDEVIGDSPDLRARLAAHNALREVQLSLDGAVKTHFPNASV